MSEWKEGKEPTEVRFKSIVHQTAGAILFEHKVTKVVGGKRKVTIEEDWIPKSQIEDAGDFEDYPKGEDGTVTIPQWLADEHNWE